MKRRIIWFSIFVLSAIASYIGYQAIANNNEILLYLFSIFVILIAICIAILLAEMNFNSSEKDLLNLNACFSKESVPENDDDYSENNFEKSLALFQKDREEELEKLLEELADARTNLAESIKSRDIKKISDAEECLDSIIDRLMTFLENYSKFGEMIHRKINHIKADKS